MAHSKSLYSLNSSYFSKTVALKSLTQTPQTRVRRWWSHHSNSESLGGIKMFQKFTSLTNYSTNKNNLPSDFCFSCTFHSVGTAAGEQKFNSLCVLSLNIINEKIYLFLWFWFFLLTSITAVHLLYRITIIILPYSR